MSIFSKAVRSPYKRLGTFAKLATSYFRESLTQRAVPFPHHPTDRAQVSIPTLEQGYSSSLASDGMPPRLYGLCKGLGKKPRLDLLPVTAYPQPDFLTG